MVELRKLRRSQANGVRRYKHIMIFDIGSLSMSHMSSDNRKILGELIGRMQALYVESTWKIFIINSPYAPHVPPINVLRRSDSVVVLESPSWNGSIMVFKPFAGIYFGVSGHL